VFVFMTIYFQQAQLQTQITLFAKLSLMQVRFADPIWHLPTAFLYSSNATQWFRNKIEIKFIDGRIFCIFD
jgi:hypothetical protein